MTSDEMVNGTLTQDDLTTVVEMTNIAMGAAASTLSLLLGHEVEIAATRITEHAALDAMTEPFAGDNKTLVAVQFVKGMFASSVFVLRTDDGRRLAELMLGNAGGAPGTPLNELEVGALGELMNQMMNAASSSMASVIHEAVEINNPSVLPYSDENLLANLPQVVMEPFAAVEMQMTIGSEAPVPMIQLLVSSELKAQVNHLLSIEPAAGESLGSLEVSTAGPAPQAAVQPQMYTQPQPQPGPQPQPAMAAAAPRGGGSAPRGTAPPPMEPVTVRPVEFASFDQQPHIFGEENKNLELVMDVTLNLTVELGKTELSIKDVLELTRGSVIELDRVAGEPVDLLANGKLIAKGEVVVIEDNFGLRITSIVSPADRLRGL